MKGWAWCSRNAEPVEHAAALRNLKLLVGSGCLEFPQGMVGMDSLNKHVEQISFRQCLTFCEHRQLKGWQPRFQITVAKSSIWTMTMTMPCTQVENSRPGWERFWTYDLNLTRFPNAFPASSKYTTVISSGLRNSSSWRLNWNYTWTTCSEAGSSAWNSKKERQEWMS